MPITEINGSKLYWESSGETGKPLVLVHGSWSDSREWEQIVPSFASTFRVYTYDRRGHSRSERPLGQGSVREDVEDLRSLIEHFDLAPAHVLGNSFGGSIVLRLAAERPDLFRSLIVHEPPLFGVLKDPAAGEILQPLQKQLQVVTQLLEKGQMENGARQFMEIILGSGSWEHFSEEDRQISTFNAPTFLDEQRDPEWLAIDLPRLADFSRPALLTQGEHSPPVFPPVIEEIEQTLSRAQRHTLRGAGHLPHLTHPEEYIEVVQSFISTAAPEQT